MIFEELFENKSMNQLFSFLVIILGFQSITFACRCEGIAEVGESVENSEFVIYGKVIDTSYVDVIETMDSLSLDSLTFKNQRYLDQPLVLKSTFVVIKNFKGSIKSDTLIIYTPRQSATCGFSFLPNKEYVVYGESASFLYDFLEDLAETDLKGREKKGTIWTNHCTRTTQYADSEVSAIEEYLLE